MSVSPTTSSPTHFMSSVAPSTVASSPPPSEDAAIPDSEFDTRQQFRERFARLERLLEKSFTYSNLLGAQMDKEKRTSALRAAMHVAPAPSGTGTRKRPMRKAPKRRIPDVSEEEASLDKPLTVEPVTTGAAEARPEFVQPSLVTGGKLKDYQLEGVERDVSGRRDHPQLSKYNWGYIVVDEGHRLKNLNCRLVQEIPKRGADDFDRNPIPCAYPNNLAELWSLLNFILPDIFDDLDTFQEWFNLGTLQSRLSPTQSTHLISTFHGILKPFLLRRLKADVEGLLPPKKEYVIYAPLSVKQRDLYDQIVEGRIRRFLIEKGNEGPSVGKKEDVNVNAPRQLRGVKGINNIRLQNTVMQLRKACSHPLLFRDSTELLPETTEELVDASGKMMLLERLLDELFRTKHKVLLFSQFTTMLDIIETWATEVKGWEICRIDGSTSPLERREQMNRFQEAGQRANAPVLFLLSTRAGGLGITLTAADTVIFYDQDWNPQMDVQAQDRAHRIGQTKPVLVFRLVTAHAIETRIMQRAAEKRKLEALVIAKGKFKMPGQVGRTKADNIADMAAALLRLEGDHIEVVPKTRAGKEGVLSDRDLGMLLDRSEAVFTDRRKGWSSEGREEGEGAVGGKKAAFAVYEVPVHNGNELNT
ncbi:P-loop containing nucleoside triphosphate hydrolase protein [Lanmaoa asiatica]|nr:P-loop containing nucleoside triphosphate hydrolase protein [Lanmaoa asiatica]